MLHRVLGFGCAAMLMLACATDDDGALRPASLADAGLVGDYVLAGYLFEYGDGARLDPSILAVQGALAITADSAYSENIVIDNDSTPTRGKITRISLEAGKAAGEILLTLENADNASAATGSSAFSFRHDTLVLVTEVSKERDTAKKGFRETAYYAPVPR